MSLEKAVYTARAKATGGRDGRATSDDQILDVNWQCLRKWVAQVAGPILNNCSLQVIQPVLGAMKFVANRDKINISKDAYIEGEVGIGPIPTGFGIEVTLNVHLEGMEQEEAQKLVDAAHIVCPYSNATRNNIDVTLNVIT